jgi:hypothetical protein
VDAHTPTKMSEMYMYAGFLGKSWYIHWCSKTSIPVDKQTQYEYFLSVHFHLPITSLLGLVKFATFWWQFGANSLKLANVRAVYMYVYKKHAFQINPTAYSGLAVTSRDDVIDVRPPYWRYFFRAARDILIEITLENWRK